MLLSVREFVFFLYSTLKHTCRLFFLEYAATVEAWIIKNMKRGLDFYLLTEDFKELFNTLKCLTILDYLLMARTGERKKD